jgi:5-enolpyruvylshikimate-3-phosphate synthase
MATSVAALLAEGRTEISDAEYCGVSFPNFYQLMVSLGAKIEMAE